MDRDALILKLGQNPELAHQSLFRHRHSDPTPPFHFQIINDWWGPTTRLLVMAFREGGKSSVAEESIILQALFEKFHNAVVLGLSLERACDRLLAIKHELEFNEYIFDIFGDVKGEVWHGSKLILRNGVCIQALGRGQSLRGMKYLHWRPDFLFCDDIEEPEHVASPEARRDTLSWFLGTVIPAMDKRARVRVAATPLDREALPITLKSMKGWVARTYPIEYHDKTGQRVAQWEARYPLDWIDAKRQEMESVGLFDDYQREYMVEAEDIKRKSFTADLFSEVVRPRVRTWQPVFAMIDPARTTKETSATTGWAVWSWMANRLIVWEAGAGLLKPDEIVGRVFEIDEQFSPVAVGVEQDGLEEFLLQPIRHEQTRRGVVIPVRGVRAPRGKLSFIESLQPYFLAKEVSFAKDLPELIKQFLSFPSGRIDAPNALAYAKHPSLYPGQVVYDGFHAGCVVEDLHARRFAPCWLALNSGAGVVTAVLAQFIDGALHVLSDAVREGDAGSSVADMVKALALDAGQAPRLVAPPYHFADFAGTGLRGGVAKIPSELRSGAAPAVGRDELRALLQRHIRDRPALLVSPAARWTLNALSAGYAYEVDKRGRLADEARPGVYRTLMEGLESFAGLMNVSVLEEAPNYRYTEGGQRYVSALPNRQPEAPSKDAPWRADDRVNDLPQFTPRR